MGVAVPFAGTDLMRDARQGWELVVDSINHTVVAEAPEDGSWVTTIAAAVSCG